MRFSNDPQIMSLYARLDDLSEKALRGEVGVTSFLTPREAMYAQSYLEAAIGEGGAYLYGGYPHAERVRAVLLPDYVIGMVTPAEGDSPAQVLANAGLDALAVEVAALWGVLQIKGSGYRELTHRDYLGSVLGLGLERDVVGDILVQDAHTAYLFCKGELVAFLTENLTHIGSDTVKVTRLSPDTPIVCEKNTKQIRDTVASPRLDCVVAALCNLSREKAQMAVKGGLVELNYEPCDRCDMTVEPSSVLSVRGVGKFTVISFDGETRKGRTRLVAEKFI